MNEFAKRLRKTRKERNLTQKQLKDITQIKSNQLNTYENGRVIPSEPNLLAIIGALDVPVDYFDDVIPYVREIKGQEIQHEVQQFIELKPTNTESKALLEVVKAFSIKLRTKVQPVS
jgi:transcriptional regulator with XRE-family HTH domain